MNVTRINIDGTMDDISIPLPITQKNIIKKLDKNAVSKGNITCLKELFKWNINGTIHLICYGWYDGDPGFENKHDLPPNGVSSFLDDEDLSEIKLLFGDIFIVLYNSKKKEYSNCTVSDYALYYNELFEGFDDCNTSDDEKSEEEEFESEDEQFINDDPESEEELLDYKENEDDELNTDLNIYSDDSDSDYNEECEGEDDEEEEDDEEDDEEDEEEEESKLE